MKNDIQRKIKNNIACIKKIKMVDFLKENLCKFEGQDYQDFLKKLKIILEVTLTIKKL